MSRLQQLRERAQAGLRLPLAPAAPRPRTGSAGVGRWAWTGAVLGLAIGVVAFAPARWLAQAVTRATEGRLLLAEAQGTIWRGSAVPVLTGGPGSRDAAAPPGRLHWRVRPGLTALDLALAHDCCLPQPATLRWQPGFVRQSFQVLDAGGAAAAGVPVSLGRWPTAWLAGLGTPWNSLELGGEAQLSGQGLAWHLSGGRLKQEGVLTVDLSDLSSRLSTLPALGSYRLQIAAPPGNAPGSELRLQTLAGPLRLEGQGSWTAQGLRFRGEARADAGLESALANLLNIIGRRQGDRSVLSIG